MHPVSLFCSLPCIAFYWIFVLLDTDPCEVADPLPEPSEPEPVVYYYQGKLPPCTILITMFEI